MTIRVVNYLAKLIHCIKKAQEEEPKCSVYITRVPKEETSRELSSDSERQIPLKAGMTGREDKPTLP